MRILAAAVLVLVTTTACTDQQAAPSPALPAAPSSASSVPLPDSASGSSSGSSSPKPARPRLAPPGFSATLLRTRLGGTVLAVRTVGSSSCAFEVDDVRVEAGVVHVVDEPPSTGGDRVCTADARPSRTTRPVPRAVAEQVRGVGSAVLHLESGRAFAVPLLVGFE